MVNSLFDLGGRIALVSGAASGMGRAMALGFAEAGADLVLADINTEGMEDTASLVEKMGRRVLPITCDVSQPDLIREMFGLDEPRNWTGRRALTGITLADPYTSTKLHLFWFCFRHPGFSYFTLQGDQTSLKKLKRLELKYT